MVLYGLTVLVFGTTGSNSAVAILLLSFLAPAVIFGALAGVYVDRFDRRLVLIVTNLLRFGLFVALAFFHANIGVILVLNVSVSIATTFFAPAELSMIPLLVPRAQLMAANGIFTLTLNAAFAIGFTFLGPLVAKVAGVTVLIVIVAGLYLVAAGFCWTLPAAPPQAHGRPDALHEAEAAVGSVIGQLKDGVAYIRGHRPVAWALTYLGIAASVVGVLGVLGPGFAQHVLGLRPEDVVVVILPLGVGVVAGVLLVNTSGRVVARRRVIESGLIVLAVCLALLTVAGPISEVLQRVNAAQPVVDVSALVSILAVVVAIAFVAGMAYSAIAIPSQTELQEEIPEAVRGRVFGILNTLVSVGSLLPIIIVGPISDAIGTIPVILIAATFIGVSGVASVLGRGPLRPLAEVGEGGRPAMPVELRELEPSAVAGPSPDEP
jgi:MFS family permease